jgi:hypothetical protein
VVNIDSVDLFNLRDTNTNTGSLEANLNVKALACGRIKQF